MKVLVFTGKNKQYHVHSLVEHVKQLDPSYEFHVEIIPPPKIKNVFGRFMAFLTVGGSIKKLVKKHNPDLVFAKNIYIMHYIDKPAICWLSGDVLHELKAEPKIHNKLLAWLQYRQARRNLEKYPIACNSNYLADNVRSGRSFNFYRAFDGGYENPEGPFNKNTTTLYMSAHPDFMTIPGTKMELKHPCVGLVQTANITIKTKGMLELEPAIKEMPDVMFYWAGDGPYKKIVKPLEKYPNFVSLGRLERSKIRQFLHSIDVYVLASGMDTLGITTLEAQMMEKPVVISNVGGTPETILHGVTGWHFTTSDQLKKHIQLLLSDPGLSQQMGKAGREFVMSKFLWSAIARQFIDCSQRVMEGKKLNTISHP